MFLFSQTQEQLAIIKKENNTQNLLSLKEKSKERKDKEKQQALEMARDKGWSTRFFKNGSFYELMAISKDNQPIYYKTFNQDAALSTRVNHLNSGGSMGLELDGQGMVAHVWDSNPAYLTHQEFDGSGGEDRASAGDGVAAYSDHGTHVTGTIIASGINPEAKGMAPHASAVGYDWNSDVPEAAEAAENGMLLSNHSYGYVASQIPNNWFGAYLQDARDFDEIMYNAPYYLQVVSCGNDGADASSNGAPIEGSVLYDKLSGMSTSKNNIAVANGQDAEVNSEGDLISMNRNNGSSEGPTDDFRIKPDIIGNGTSLISPVGGSDASYGNYTGTSMSGPNVMGSLLLLQQYYSNVHGSFMKASTLKGLALHTADDITPENSNSPTQSLVGPDATTGWGLLNAKKAAETITNEGFTSIIKEEVLADGETFTLNVKSDGTSPLVASISWTDVPGELASGIANDDFPALVNDLDIRITKATGEGVTTFEPWKLTSINTNSLGDNTVDPYEKVAIEEASGDYTITVTHKGTLVNSTQNFSLVVTGSLSDINITTINPTVTQCSTSSADFYFDYLQQIGTTTSISVENLPVGTTASVTPSTISENGQVVVSISGLENVVSGTYSIDVVANNGTDIQNRKVQLRVIHPDFSDNPMILSSPVNGEIGVLPSGVLLQWDENINAEGYLLEVSDKPSFENLLTTVSLSDSEYSLQDLSSNTVYYWRVIPTNQCGVGSTTEVYSFQTAEAENCSNVYIATDFSDDRISAGSNSSASLPIVIPDDLTISRLIVSVDISHLAIGELEVFIQEPSELGSNTTMLLENVCEDAPNVTNAVFDDTGSELICGSSDPAVTGTIRPSESLSSSSGKSALGTWLLIANDETFQNGGLFSAGYLDGASIAVCTVEPNLSVPNFTNNLVDVVANGVTSLTASDMNASTSGELASQQVYTIITSPTKGSITKDGAALAVGNTFTQDDINSGSIAYANAQTTLFTDSFKVDITNSLNGWLANQEVYIEATTLKTDVFDSLHLSMHPNPSNGRVHIRFKSASDERIKVWLVDLQGRKVFSSSYSGDQTIFEQSISTREFANGLYLLNVSQGKRKSIKKLFISE